MGRDIVVRLFCGYNIPIEKAVELKIIPNDIDLDDWDTDKWKIEKGICKFYRIADKYILSDSLKIFLSYNDDWKCDFSETSFILYHDEEYLKEGGLDNDSGIVSIRPYNDSIEIEKILDNILNDISEYGLHWEIIYSY